MIDKKTIQDVIGTLVKAYQPLEIYLFGSYAWGQPNDESDLDLLIVVEKTDEPSFKRPAKGYKELYDLMVPTDILVYTKKEFETFSKDASRFCFKIKNNGRKIYAKA